MQRNFIAKAAAAALFVQSAFLPNAQAALAPNAGTVAPAGTQVDITTFCPVNGRFSGNDQLSEENKFQHAVLCARFWYGSYLCTRYKEPLTAMINQATGAGYKLDTSDIDPVAFPKDEKTPDGQLGRFSKHIKANGNPTDMDVDTRAQRGKAWATMAAGVITQGLQDGTLSPDTVLRAIRSPAFDGICSYNKSDLAGPK